MMAAPTLVQRGWTLVELMVGMTLGLLLLAGVGQIYLAAKRSYDIQASIAEVQDIGRYAIDVLTQDIHMAGYWDLLDMTRSPQPTLTGNRLSDTCVTNTDGNWGRAITNRIFGLNDNSPNIATSYACLASDRLAGTDVLTVRYADPATVAPGKFKANRLYIRTAPFEGSIMTGGPGSVTDPVFSDHAVVTHSYYISENTSGEITCSSGTVIPPALARKILDSNGEAHKESLVNNVEQLQFQYGIDLANSGQVQRYVSAADIANWNQVMAVKIWVLVRPTCPDPNYVDTKDYAMGDITYPASGPMKDGFRRTVFSTTVALRNCREILLGTNYKAQC